LFVLFYYKATWRCPDDGKATEQFRPFFYYNMKQFYLKTLVILLMSMVGEKAFAYDCEVDGIYYNLNEAEKSAEVTYGKPTYNSYVGDIDIPARIICKGNTYNVTSISSFAFRDCSNMVSINIPNSVSHIGYSAFSGCTALTSIIIPNSVTIIETSEMLFSRCTNLVSIIVSESNPKYDSRNNCNAIIETATNTLICACKNTIIPNSVTTIGAYAFLACTGLTSITIPNGVANIGYYAFGGCTDLASVSIPGSVTSIGELAFFRCYGLTSVDISNGVISIGERAFEYCTSLASISIGNSVSSIGNEAFNGCKALTSITIPNSVTSIGYSAFSGCIGLTSITIPNSVTSIGHSAFFGCTGLTKVFMSDIPAWCAIQFSDGSSNPLCYAHHLYSDENTEITNLVIPNSVTSIGNNTFFGCTGLTSITIPNSVTSIGQGAFSGCSGLTSITIPSSVTDIEQSAFYNCTGLTSIDIPSSVTSIGQSAFSNCSGLISFTIPNGVTSIGVETFRGCTGLTSIIIPNNVTSIGDYAFQNCSGLTAITIPNSVTSIGTNAFSGCTSLKLIVCDNPTPPTAGYGSFPSNAVGIVPESSVTAYKSATGWSSLTFNQVVFDYLSTQTKIKLATSSIFSEVYAKIGETEYYPVNDTITITNLKPNTEYQIQTFGKYGSMELNNTLTIKTKPITLSTGASSTNVTATFWGSYDAGDAEIKEHGFEKYSLEDVTQDESGRDVLTLKDLTPGKTITVTYYVILADGTKYVKGQSVNTEPVKLSTGYSSTNVTLTVWGETDAIDAEIKEHGFEDYSAEEITQDESGRDILIIKDLKPGASLKLTYYVILSDGTKLTKEQTAYTKSISLSTGYSSTNVTLKVWGKHEVDDAVITEYGFTGRKGEQELTITDCKPGETYYFTYYVITSDGSKYTREIHASTKPIYIYLNATAVTPTTARVTGRYDVIDATVQDYGFESHPDETELSLSGLNPDANYREVFFVNTKEGGKITKVIDFKTAVLTLTTLQPKVISPGNVIVAAESNIDDGETNVGFEWRRTDWTNDFESNRGGAYLFNGMMEGYIRNLNTEKLWKYRPYYESNAGRKYYGDWVGLDPTNTSYFEPTVHTYAQIGVEGNSAEVRGYVMRGSDNVVQQGFKYWKQEAGARAEGNRAPSIPADAKTVEAEGTVMTAELKGLDYESEYCVVAFVKTSENEMFYGEQQTFRTGIDVNGVEEVTASPGTVTEVARYDLNGRKISAEANSSLFTIHYSLKKGLNIIRMSDGTVKKVMVK